MAKITELDKWADAHDDVMTIEQFLEWLESRGIQLCEQESDEWGTRFWVTSKSHRQLLEEYFEIDAQKLEQERRALLEESRQKQRLQ